MSNSIRLKKNTFVSKLARNFQTDVACGFLFFISFFFYLNWPLPPRTSETKNHWKVWTSVFSEIKRDFTRFLSSHVLKFFQNSKLSFFVVKMEKKNYFKKKKMKVWILQNQMRTEKQMRAAALRHRIFFFSLREKWKRELWGGVEPYRLQFESFLLVGWHQGLK